MQVSGFYSDFQRKKWTERRRQGFKLPLELWGRGGCQCDGVVPERRFKHLLFKAWIQCSLVSTASSKFCKLKSCFLWAGCSYIWVWFDSSEPSDISACAAWVLSSGGHALNKPGAPGGSWAVLWDSPCGHQSAGGSQGILEPEQGTW